MDCQDTWLKRINTTVTHHTLVSEVVSIAERALIASVDGAEVMDQACARGRVPTPVEFELVVGFQSS